MLGAFEIFKGPHNRIAEELGVPKQCDITLGYSRDGFHFADQIEQLFLRVLRKRGHGIMAIFMPLVAYAL